MTRSVTPGGVKPLRRRTIAIQIVALAISLVVGCVLLLAKLDAEAAPLRAATTGAQGAASPAGPAGAGALATAASDANGASPASPASPASDAGDDAQSPIDLAIAPDGGVPFHPIGTTTYKSPFAKPNAGTSVRIKVGMLLNG